MEEKKYLISHPWIKFELDARHFPFELWTLLGAAQSKCKHLTRIALRPQKQKDLLGIYMLKGIHATTAIEGNSLSEEEVGKIIDGSSDLPKSKEYQEMEVRNVLDAYNGIVEQIGQPSHSVVSYEQIIGDNRIILNGFAKSEVVPGEIRAHSVVVGSYRGAPAEDCEFLLRRLCDWLNDDWGLGEGNNIMEAILKAILGHLYLAWIHPFADGNGRTARTLELRILLNDGVPNIAAHLLSNFYNETRHEYYSHLKETSSSKDGSPEAFILYAIQGFVDALDKQINIILDEQLRVIWTNFVYGEFGGKEIERRRRDLLLGISELTERNGKPIELEELRMRLSSEVLKRYDGKSSKTFSRDIDELIEKGFIKSEKGKISLNMSQLQGFLPVSKNSPRL